MPSQIEIDIRANVSQAEQAVRQLTQDVQRLKQQMAAPGTPGSGLLTPLPSGLGGPRAATPLLDAATEAAKRNTQALREIGTAGETAGERVSRGFGGIERMLERMAIRLIVVKLIFEAIRAVAAVITESINWELFSRRFEALSGAGQNAARNLQEFQRIAKETGQSAEDIGKVELSLEASGESARNATSDVEALGKMAVISGDDIKQLAKDLEAIKLGTGSIDQMREFTFAMEGAQGSTLAEVNSLKELEVELKNQEPIYNRIYELQRRAADEQQRQTDTVEEFGQHLKLGDFVLQQMANRMSTYGAQLHIVRQGHEVARVNLGATGDAMARMLAIGNQRIMQEEGISSTALRQLEQYGLIDASFVLSAYHRQVEDQRRKEQQQHEDTLANNRIIIALKELALQQLVTKEFTNRETTNKNFAAVSQTAAIAWQQMQQSVATLAQDLPGIAASVKSIAQAIQSVVDNIAKFTGQGQAGQPPKPIGRGGGGAQWWNPFYSPSQKLEGPEQEGRRQLQQQLDATPIMPPTSMLGPSQRETDIAIREALSRNRWASAERGIPAGYRSPGEGGWPWPRGYENLPYPQPGDIIPGVAGQTFTKLPMQNFAKEVREAALRPIGEAFRPGAGQMTIDLMKQGRHADYREAVRRGLIPDVQAQAAQALLTGGGVVPFSNSPQAQAAQALLAGGGAYQGGHIVGGYVPTGPTPGTAAMQGAGQQINVLNQILNILQNHYDLHKEVFGGGQ